MIIEVLVCVPAWQTQAAALQHAFWSFTCKLGDGLGFHANVWSHSFFICKWPVTYFITGVVQSSCITVHLVIISNVHQSLPLLYSKLQWWNEMTDATWAEKQNNLTHLYKYRLAFIVCHCIAKSFVYVRILNNWRLSFSTGVVRLLKGFDLFLWR